MKSLKQLNRMTFVVTISWVVTVLFTAGINFWSEYKHYIIEEPLEAARDSFELNRSLRLWFSSHGGVYVPVTATTPSNPYLTHILDRDILTPSDKKLTLLNPAYGIRHFAEFAQDSKVIWSLTRLN